MGTEAAARSEVGEGDLPPARPERWDRWRIWVVTAVVVGWLTVQLAVPVARLLDRGGAARPRTFGWQMFSHQLSEPAESFTITTSEGTRTADIRPLLSSPMRREILYAPYVVAALCSDPDVISVGVHDAEWGASEVPCR